MIALTSRNRRLTYFLLLVLMFLVAPSLYADRDKDRKEWEKERREALKQRAEDEREWEKERRKAIREAEKERREAYREARKDRQEALQARRRQRDYYDDRYDRDGRNQSYRNSARRMGLSQGYRDGYEKGQEDYRKNRAADLYRHERYREADHGYRDEYGDRASYEDGYRQGFENGYDEGFVRFVRNRY